MAKDEKPSDAALNERAVQLHRHYRGKIQVVGKCPLTGHAELALWYTPGVAAVARAIQRDPRESWALTNRANSVAIVSDGSRVLGLGDIGPAAGLPVMEGKALLFKHFGGVDAVPLCLDAADPEQLVAVVKALAPSFGAINLEDIAAPKCFRVLERLRAELPIPVWHDDQQGSATVVLAALTNALELVGKELQRVRIALIGVGAANMAVYRLLKAVGVAPSQILACDRGGLLHGRRGDIESQADRLAEKWQVCRETNPDCRAGGIAEALAGADVCIAFSSPGPGTIAAAAVAGMAGDAIVFACANPVPEIWPAEALAAGARVVATGRSDFPNQLNNSLAFPGLFRGVLDVRASAISDGMAEAAAGAIAGVARRAGLAADAILPPTDSIEVAVEVAVAAALRAQAEGLAAPAPDRATLAALARGRIEGARALQRALLAAGGIEALPAN